MRKWCACVLTLFCSGLCVSAIAQLNHIGGQVSIVDWPVRTPENAQLRLLEIDWSLDTDTDSPVLSLKGRWLLGVRVEINGQDYPVCDSGYVRAPEPEGCAASTALKPVMGRFDAVAAVSSPVLYHALMRLPLPTSWSSQTSFETIVRIPWDQLIFKGQDASSSAEFYSAAEAKEIVAQDFTLDRLLLTDVEFSLSP